MAASAPAIMKTSDEAGNFFTRMPWYYQMLLLLGLVVVLIFAVDMMMYSATRAETVQVLQQVEALRAKNQQGSLIRQNLAETEKALQEKREEIDRLRDLLPDAVEISRVYDSIKDFARAERLEMKKFAHMKNNPSDFYTAQPIEVEVSGGYDSLGQFFSRLGFFTRIVSVTEVEIKNAEDSAQEFGRSINASFIVTAYYISPENLENLMKPPAPAPAAGNNGKPGPPKQAAPAKKN